MLEKASIEKIVNNIISQRMHLSPERWEITPLRGDASNRRYYRLHFTVQVQPRSFVVMELSEPEGFKKSEEKVSTSHIPIKELPYINILRHLAACEVAVPELYYYEEKRGWLFLEDLGDVTLRDELKGRDLETHRRYYIQAIDELLRIQIQGTRLANPDCIAFGRAFDSPLLMWEFDHFLEYGVEVHQQKKMAPIDLQRARTAFEGMIRPLVAEPRYLTHRDYHSRNLMIQGGKIRVLDFQDALMGPAQYDLASLLRDSYLSLPEDLIGELVDYYIDRKQDLEGVRVDGQQFLRLFDFMSIQRNLKAAGRFVYIDAVKHNPNYLQFIPPTLGNVRKNLSKYPELGELQKVLCHYVGDLR